MRRGATVVLLLLAGTLLAGCSGSPPADTPIASPPLTSPGIGNHTAPKGAVNANATNLELFGRTDLRFWTEKTCTAIESEFAVPITLAAGAMPPGFTPQSIDGSTTATALLLSLQCTSATGNITGAGEMTFYYGFPANAPKNVASGNDAVIVQVVGNAAYLPAYQAAGFPALDGTTVLTLAGQAPALAGTATVAAQGVNLQHGVGGTTVASDPAGFVGRFFAVKDNAVTGVLDYRLHDGLAFALGPSTSVATAGAFGPAPATALIGAVLQFPEVDMRLAPLPLPPAFAG